MSFLHRLAYALPHHFWTIWVLGLAMVLAIPLCLFCAGPKENWQDAPVRSLNTAARPSKWVLSCFAGFLAVYVGFMLSGEDFSYKDGHSFTEFSAIGKLRPPAIWADPGRFWPLGYQEYNLIARLSPTATAYLAYGAAQLIVGLWLLYVAMPGENPTLCLLSFVVLMLAPAFGADFAELTYADRNVVFAICVLVFALQRYDRRPGVPYLLMAITAGYCALFYKETSVALLGGFAASRLLLRVSRCGWRRALRSPLEIGLLLACGCFALELGLTLLPAGRSTYVDDLSVGWLAAAVRYMRADPLLVAFLFAYGFNIISILRGRSKIDPLWDPLATGAVLHFAAVSATGVAETYLIGPTELVSALTLLRLVPRWWKQRPHVRPLLTCLGGVVVAASVAFGTFRLIQRKIVVRQTQKIAEFVQSYYQTKGARGTRLYLAAEEGVVADFISFLSYRGLSFHRQGEQTVGDAIDVAGAARFEGDRCVSFIDLVCRHDVPRAGDLVVRLPEEQWSPTPGARRQSITDLGLHDARSELQFQASPEQFFPPARSLLSVLYRVSPTLTGLFPDGPLPDDWLCVSAMTLARAPSPSLAPPG